ncbi:MAG TPA: HIT family protein [Gemmatimonadaceae bacterium]|nr:HIT family protein [Gemmatimonadaceae bacterium]
MPPFHPQPCPICRDGGPQGAFAELEVSTVVLPDPAPLRGYAVLFLRRHAVELYELSDDEANAFMRDLRRLARAVQQATGAPKLNYEIHGNTIAHLHLHLFPRYPDDPFVGRPIHPRETTAYPPAEYARLRRAIAAALGHDRAPRPSPLAPLFCPP